LTYRLNPNNLQAHLDIEADIARIHNGILNFVVKVNRSNLIDYVIYENVTTRNAKPVATSSYRKTSG